MWTGRARCPLVTSRNSSSDAYQGVGGGPFVVAGGDLIC